MKLKSLIGSGDKIMLFTLPFVLLCIVLNYFLPGLFDFNYQNSVFNLIIYLVLLAGIFLWLWSVYLILVVSSRGKLITTGPYKLVKHPIYTSVSLLVLPAISIIMGSWLGIVLGLIMYLATRRYAPLEEKQMSKAFGNKWDSYIRTIKIPWV